VGSRRKRMRRRKEEEEEKEVRYCSHIYLGEE